MDTTRISRRHMLKAGAGLAGALALPTIVTSRGMAAAGTQPVNMQLGRRHAAAGDDRRQRERTRQPGARLQHMTA